MLGTVPGAGTQQETEPTLPCLLRLLTQPGGDRLETEDLLDGVMGRQDKKSWIGGSEWCAGLGGALLLVTWQSGVPPS